MMRRADSNPAATEPLSRALAIAVFAVLLAVMIVTRFHHFGTALNLPDASMAVYFLGGLYLRGHRAFVAFLVAAVLIDWIAIDVAGVSSFCVTPAYAFLLPAYAVLWYGGRAMASHRQANAVGLAQTFAVALLAGVVSFAISNGSFYWLGGRIGDRSLAGWLASLGHWGPAFVGTMLGYVAVGLLLHAGLLRYARLRAPLRTR